MLTRYYAQLIVDLCVCPKRVGIQNLTFLKIISNFAFSSKSLLKVFFVVVSLLFGFREL